jgi:DNA-binding transcriptional MocR family regulator
LQAFDSFSTFPWQSFCPLYSYFFRPALASLPFSETTKIAQAGLYIRTTLKKRLRDHNVVTAGAKRGLVLAPLSPHYLEPSRTFPAVQGLLLGFAAFKPMELRSGVTELKKVVQSIASPYYPHAL